VAREVHGPDYDPSTEPIDGEVVMRAGGGKKHGRYMIGDGTLDTTTIPTLSQIRVRSTSSSPPYAHGRTLHSLRWRLYRLSWQKKGGHGRRWNKGLWPSDRRWNRG